MTACSPIRTVRRDGGPPGQVNREVGDRVANPVLTTDDEDYRVTGPDAARPQHRGHLGRPLHPLAKGQRGTVINGEHGPVRLMDDAAPDKLGYGSRERVRSVHWIRLQPSRRERPPAVESLSRGPAQLF